MEQLDLSFFFTTKAQASDFSSRLSAVSEKIYTVGFNLEKILANEIGIQKKDKFITLLRENKIHTESNSELKMFLDMLQKKISTLPVLSLTIPFEPQDKTLISISEWFVVNLNKQVLFEINIDRSLIAGAAITYQGKFMDFSIRPQFEQIVKRIITPPIATDQNKLPNAHQNL